MKLIQQESKHNKDIKKDRNQEIQNKAKKRTTIQQRKTEIKKERKKDREITKYINK